MNHNISEAVRCAKHSEHYDIMYLAQAVGELLEYQNIGKLDAALGQALRKQPVAIPDCGEAGHADGACGNKECLPSFRRNTTPPQRKPLTDEEIDQLLPEIVSGGTFTVITYGRAVARAIEAAHGIKGEA